MAEKKIIPVPTDYVGLGEAILIVKHLKDDPDSYIQMKTKAIERVAEMETHNSVTKDDLLGALRWLFDHYEF